MIISLLSRLRSRARLPLHARLRAWLRRRLRKAGKTWGQKFGFRKILNRHYPRILRNYGKGGLSMARRDALALLLAGGLMFCNDAQALVFSTSGSNASTVASISVVNTSGSTVAANAVAPSFGHPFRPNDIAPGTWPQLKLSDGTPVPATIYQPTYWPGNSMRFACFLPIIPEQVPGNGSLTVNVCSGGSQPAPSSRTLADLTAQSLTMSVTGQYNISSTWQSILNNGINNVHQSNSGAGADIIKYADGPGGAIYRIRASFEQSNSPHGALEGYWYCVIPQNASGGLYGLRILPMILQPWYDTAVTKQFLAFSAMQFLNGATVIQDLIANAGTNPALGVGQTVTATNGNAALALGSSSTLNQLMSNYGGTFGANVMCLLSGSPPTGFATNTPYWGIAADSTHITLQSGGNDGGTVTPSSSGSFTATPYPYISPFGAEVFCSVTGKYNFIQGGGSASADAPLRIQYDRSYWCATGMIPPYTDNITPNATPSPVPTKVVSVVYPFDYAQGTTGDRPEIGNFTQWNANHVFTGNVNDEQTVRVCAMIGMTEPWWLRNSTTRTVPVYNRHNYPGLPNGNANFQWDGSSNINGITSPPTVGTGNASFQTWDQQAGSVVHKAEYHGYAYMFTGEVQYLDAIVNLANMTLSSLYPGGNGDSPTPGIAIANTSNNCIGGVRNVVVNGTTYNTVLGGQARQWAWGMRNLYLAVALCGSHPESAQYVTYFTDIVNDTIGAILAFNAMNSSAGLFYSTANIMWLWGTEQAIWQSHGYGIQALCWGHGLTQDSNTFSLISYMVGFYTEWFNQTGCCYELPAYGQSIRKSGNTAGPIVSAFNQLGSSNEANNVTWNASGFTLTDNIGGGYIQSNGDIVTFSPGFGAPGGFSTGTPYFVVSSSGPGLGATFKLSATLGGSPITPTDTGTNSAFFQMVSPQPANGFLFGNPGNTNYGTLLPMGLRYAVSRGVSVNASMYNDFLARWGFYNVDFTPGAKFDYAAAA